MANSVVENRINSIRIKGILQQVFGWPIAAFFVMFTIASFSTIEEPFDFGMSMFCLAVTAVVVWLLVLSLKNMNLIKTFRNYSDRLSADPVKSLNSLASSMGVSDEIVTKNISAMLNKGLFPNAYLDKKTNCLVFTDPLLPVQQTDLNTPPLPVSLVTVHCMACGVANKIEKGSVAKCEFCGSYISMEE